MATALVRVDAETLLQLKELAREQKVSLSVVVARATDRLRRDRFWSEFDAERRAAANDADAAWDATSMDGLTEEPWYDDPRVAKSGSSTSVKRKATSKRGAGRR